VSGDAGFIETEHMLARMKRLPVRLRVAHLAALLRRAAANPPRAYELERLIAMQSPLSIDGGRAG
jgi:hypothetical protein